MADYTAQAAYDVNRWLWSELVAAGILEPSAYHSNETNSNLVPIIPVSQRPEFVDQFGDRPLIVYDYVVDYSEPDFWMINCEQIMFTIYSGNYQKANEVKSLMVDLFRRHDESAKDLNHFNTLSNNTGLGYLEIQVLQTSKTEPIEEIGGRWATDVVIEVKYVRGIGSSSGYGVGRYA
jgi:hypothetical protein